MEKADPGRTEILAPDEIALARVDGVGLTLRVRGGKEHGGVRIYNPLPFAGALRYVCFTDKKGAELAMVRVDERLTGAIRALIDEELAKRYIRAVIRRIVSIDVEGRTSYWEVETDRGQREFVLTNTVENIQRPSPGHVVITDVHENRFEIPDQGGLDLASRRLLDLVF